MNQTILAGALSAVSLSLAAPAFAGPVLDKVMNRDSNCDIQMQRG